MKKKLLFQSGLALFVCLFLFAGVSFAQTKTMTMTVTNSSQWQVPNEIDGETVTSVTSITFEAWGGGGAGGYAYTSGLIKTAGGGGGAAYAKTTLNDAAVGQQFSITVGARGTAVGDSPTAYTVTNGGTTSVERNGNVIVKAVGGKTVEGVANNNGAAGGSASECVGDVRYSGGNGGKAYPGLNLAFSDNPSGAWCISGSGGGAAGPGGNGGNAEDSRFNGNIIQWILSGFEGHALQITGVPGSGNGSGAGSGASGNESQIFGGGGWGNTQGDAGGNYGGGGSGAIGNGLSWGDANGGQGGSGAVRIVITYTTSPVVTESVEIADASANVCSGADFDVTLNITADGFSLSNATVIPNSTSNPSLSVSAGTSFNTTDGKWHLTGSATNTTSNPIEFPITVTVTTPDGSASDNATITLNVYGELDGGVIAADQFVCQDQTIQIIKGNGDAVYSYYYDGDVTTAPATGGSGDGSYQWKMKTTSSGDYSDVTTGGDGVNFTPTVEGITYYKRAYTDNVCETTVYAGDGAFDNTYIRVITVNPFNPGNLSGSDEICINEDFTKTLQITEFTSPAIGITNARWNVYWQESYDNGLSWSTVQSSSHLSYNSVINFTYTINFNAGDLTTGEIQYRYALAAYNTTDGTTCTMVPCNGVYKLIVGENAVDYTDQFTDKEITLYYGECERDITDLAAPDLNPAPASITRGTDGITTVTPGNEYNITWIVVPEGTCSAPQEYTQKVIVKFPACGTVDEPYVITDNGNEYQTIRIDCECWLAENLRTEATNATYYDNDDANAAFGRLYDWNDAVGSNNEELPTMLGTTYIQGICPDGWAIPTVEQFNTMKSIAGTVQDIRSDDPNAWVPEEIGTNTSGFAAMGAGFFSGMQYQRLRGYTDFWTADLNESNTTVAKAMELRVGCDDLLVVDKNKADKISVRCVRVEPVPSATDCGTVTIDGVDYETVIIGSQCWTKRNLRTTVAADGTPITNPQPVATSNDIPYYYKFKYSTYSTIVPIPEEDQGYLYNWAAALVVCPTGWHLPSDAEWTELEQNFTTADLSGTGYRGDHAGKLAGTDYWKTTNTVPNAPGDYDNPDRNVSGFTAVPAGHTSGGSYGQARSMTKFWSSTEYNNDYAWYRHFFYSKSGVGRMNTEATKKYGLSVRCVKD